MRRTFCSLTPRFFVSVAISLFAAIALFGSAVPMVSSWAQSGKKIQIRFVGQNNSHIRLQEGRELDSAYIESSPGQYSAQSAAGGASMFADARPLALATGDVNLDGFPDLVSGYARQNGGLLTLHLGSPGAFAPGDPVVLKGIAKGRFPDPFLQKSNAFGLPEAPDFIATGDFNRDGRQDVIVAARAGNSLYLLPGDGLGGFGAIEQVILPGAVTALMGEDLNERDGLADLVVGVNSDGKSAILVYDTRTAILAATPSTYSLPADVRSLAAGDLDDDRSRDIAMVSGNQILVLHGREQLSGLAGFPLDERAGQFEPLNIPFAVRVIALGDFVSDRDNRVEMAILSEDGAVQIASRGHLDTRPRTAGEMQQARREMVSLRREKELAIERGKPMTTALPSREPLKWEVIEDLSSSVRAVTAGSDGVALLGTRMSGLPSEDLLIMDATGRRLQIISSEQGAGRPSGKSPAMSAVELASDGDMVAALPMRVNVDGRPGLVVLRKGGVGPLVFSPLANSTFTVNTVNDTDDAAVGNGTCADSSGDCSLRAAIQEANFDAINDTVTFSSSLNGVPIKLTQVGNDGNSGQGDLDINTNMVIQGNGAPNTIIQGADDANFTNAIGDKIFGINQDGIFNSLTVSITGVTIRYARNTVPFGDPSFAFTGAGMDAFLTGLGNSLVFTNCTFDNNANAFSYGGGVNIDSFTGGVNGGTVDFNGCTFTNNKLQEALASQSGAGVNLFADVHNVSFTNCAFNGNQAQNNCIAAGINIRHTNGGTITINNTNVTNNTAGSHSGGIQTSFNQIVNMNNCEISGNSAGGDGGGFNAGGGVANLSNLTISNNSASSSGGGLLAALGTLNVSLSRIAGNTAATGSGIAQTGGSAIVENNWWGCDGFPNAAGCQTGTGTFDADPRIDLRFLPASVTLAPGGTQGFTASVNQNTNATSINPFVLNGLTITFGNTPGLGSVAPGSAVLSSLTASTTFTANSICPSPNTGTVSATLDNGTATSSVTVQQATAISACPADQTVSADPGQCWTSVSFTPPTATAGCPTPTVICRIGLSPITSPHTFAVGVTTVTCTASNGSSPDQLCAFTVTVNDTQPPTIGPCPSDITVSEAPPGSGSATVTYATPSSNDNCPGQTVSCIPPSGSSFPTGSTIVTCTATDASSNTASCMFTVQVLSACTIACPANISVGNTPGLCGAVVTFAPTTSAGCGSVVCSPASGAFFPVGSTPVSCTAMAGPNCSFTVTVVDTQPPTIVCPANVSATATTGQTSAVVNYPAPTVSDNCPGAAFVCSPASGSNFPLGTTTVTCTATDAHANQASCSFTVSVSGSFLVNADSFLRDGADNKNEGANNVLRIQDSGHNRVVVRFDLTGISTSGLQSAMLVLNITENSDNWGATGRLVDAHRLTADWTEGNGHTVGPQPNFRGTGEGVTWNCAKDADISNMNDDCTSQWNGGTFAAATAAPVPHTNGQMGDVSWNVTADVLAGAGNGWVIKKQNEGQNGQVRYHSKEGAAVAGNPSLGPRLVLTYAP